MQIEAIVFWWATYEFIKKFPRDSFLTLRWWQISAEVWVCFDVSYFYGSLPSYAHEMWMDEMENNTVSNLD